MRQLFVCTTGVPAGPRSLGGLNFPEGADMPILLAMSDFAQVDAAEYQGVITKPYEKAALLEKVAGAMMPKTKEKKSRRATD